MNPRWMAACFLVVTLAPTLGRAEVEGVEFFRREVVADGHRFGAAGAYEKLVGRVRFSLDPEAEANRAIVDLALAPRDADGRVRFSSDFFALRPVSTSNGSILLEVPNRGGKASVRYFHRGATRTNDPSARADFGDALLLERGMSLVWLGWQFDVPRRPHLLRLHARWAEAEPPIRGLVRADHVFAEPSRVFPLAHRDHRPYAVAHPDDARNVLTVRDTRLGERTTIPRDRWRFARIEGDGRVVADRRFVHYADGFVPGKIYELVYVADRPAVVGLGMAAMRDFASFMKHDESSPIAGRRVLGVGISQTGRFLRTFLYQGFNRDLEGRPAFDGLLVHTAGAGRGSFNHRFAQPSRDAHPFSAFLYPTDIFPFTGRSQHDPETSLREGLLENPAVDSANLPKVFFTNTGYEYWGRAASLIHTAIDGRADVPLLDHVRAFHFAGGQHFVDRFPPSTVGTAYPANPANFFFLLRALLVRLDDWVAGHRTPPASRIPRLADDTLTSPDALRFPSIPGVRVPERAHEAYRVDYGPKFRDRGIVEIEPPEVGRAFPTLVPQVDADGNELGGIRLPQIAVPVATYTPWNFRAAETGAPDELADFRGSFLPFAADTESRAAGDPRPSIAERYPSRDAYLGAYAHVTRQLMADGLLLAEDFPELFDIGIALWDLVTASDP